MTETTTKMPTPEALFEALDLAEELNQIADHGIDLVWGSNVLVFMVTPKEAPGKAFALYSWGISTEVVSSIVADKAESHFKTQARKLAQSAVKNAINGLETPEVEALVATTKQMWADTSDGDAMPDPKEMFLALDMAYQWKQLQSAGVVLFWTTGWLVFQYEDKVVASWSVSLVWAKKIMDDTLMPVPWAAEQGALISASVKAIKAAGSTYEAAAQVPPQGESSTPLPSTPTPGKTATTEKTAALDKIEQNLMDLEKKFGNMGSTLFQKGEKIATIEVDSVPVPEGPKIQGVDYGPGTSKSGYVVTSGTGAFAPADVEEIEQITLDSAKSLLEEAMKNPQGFAFGADKGKAAKKFLKKATIGKEADVGAIEVSVFPVENMLSDTRVFLREATQQYQPVKGSSSNARYFMLGMTLEGLRIAARWRNGDLSMRIEGPQLAHDQFRAHAQAVGFSNCGIKYGSFHVPAPSALMAAKIIGSAMLALSSDWITKPPDVDVIHDKGQ